MKTQSLAWAVFFLFSFNTVTFCAPLTSLTPAAAPADTLRIGVVAASKGSVKIDSKTQAGRIAQTGEPVFIGDTVSTDSEGSLQILLLDETVFTIGPNSAIVIDKFIYDPASQTGQVNAKVVKGVFRFVTGKIARKKPSDMRVDLPSGSIGVRGTIVAGETVGQKSTVILLGPGAKTNTQHRIGQITVGNGNKEVTVTRPGFGTVIDGPGGAPSNPYQIPAAELSRITTALTPPVSVGKNATGKGGGGDPTQEAGQDTAAAGDTAAISGENSGLTKSLSEQSAKASQSAISSQKVLDGISTFDDLSRIQTGKYTYSQSGFTLYDIPHNPVGHYDLNYIVDFGARTAGGGGTSSSVFAIVGSDSATFLLGAKPFGSGSSPATFTYPPITGTTPNLAGVCTSNCTANITVNVNNSNGVVADTASSSVSFTSSGTFTGSGTTGSHS